MLLDIALAVFASHPQAVSTYTVIDRISDTCSDQLGNWLADEAKLLMVMTVIQQLACDFFVLIHHDNSTHMETQ